MDNARGRRYACGMRSILLISIGLIAACGPGPYSPYHHAAFHNQSHVSDRATTHGEPHFSAPPAYEGVHPQPSPEQSPVEWVVGELKLGQYTCESKTAETYVCWFDENWGADVSVHTDEQGKTRVWFQSATLRAFGRPCAEFSNYVADLTEPSKFYRVSCSDETKAFLMETYVDYIDGIDWAAWLTDHRNRRFESWQQLHKHGATKE